MTQATAEQVRKDYQAQGLVVRISKDGHITYRHPAALNWSEGRWVSEYRVTEDGKVVLT
jgi:hypothetical protein